VAVVVLGSGSPAAGFRSPFPHLQVNVVQRTFIALKSLQGRRAALQILTRSR
jgi:hypothetical protein